MSDCDDEDTDIEELHPEQIVIPPQLSQRRVVVPETVATDLDFTRFCSQQNPLPATPRSPRVLSEVLANGKRAHIIIKDDPEVEKAQDELFRTTVIGALNPTTSPQCREDIKITLDIMLHAKEALNNKRTENESEFALYRNQHLRRNDIDDRVLIGKCVASRKRNVFITTEEEREILYQCMANDLASTNIALTYSDVCELQAGKSGAVLHVKLKYRSVVGLVPDSSLDKHIRIAQELVAQCFPQNTHDMTVLVSDPIVKLARTNPERSQPLLCKTMYLIWPYIVIHEIFPFIIFWKTLDMRISAQDPFYSNVVDAHLVSTSQLRLRRAGCHRVTACKYCKVPKAQPISSAACADFEFSESDISDYEAPVAPLNRTGSFSSSLSLSQQSNSRSSENSRSQSPFQTCYHCIKGKVVSAYEVLHSYGYVSDNTNVINKRFFDTMPMLEQLQYSCIVRTQEQQDKDEQEDVCFQVPEDAPGPDDRSHAAGGCPQDVVKTNCGGSIGYGCNFILYASEAKRMRQFATAKTNEVLSPQMRPDLFALCTRVIRTVNPIYQYLVASHITLRHAKKDICVNVQGKNMRFCFLHGSEHPNNRIYFVIRPRTNSVTVQCFFEECTRIMGIHAKIEKFKIHKSRGKRFGSAAGAGITANLIPPKENLLPEQIEAITFTKAEISVDSGWRVPLHEALHMVYMGKKRNEHRFRTPQVHQVVQTTNLEQEPRIYDRATGVDLPRSLIPQTLEQKIEYLATQRITAPSTFRSYDTEPGYVPFIRPIAAQNTAYMPPTARQSREERQREYERIRLQNKTRS